MSKRGESSAKSISLFFEEYLQYMLDIVKEDEIVWWKDSETSWAEQSRATLDINYRLFLWSFTIVHAELQSICTSAGWWRMVGQVR